MCKKRKKKKESCCCFYRFLHLDLIDLDAEQFVFEVVVEIESVSVLHVFASGILVEDSCLSTGEGLQRAIELSLLCEDRRRHMDSVIQLLRFSSSRGVVLCIQRHETYAGGSTNLLHAEFLLLVKHQQHQRLEQGDLQLLLSLQDKVVVIRNELVPLLTSMLGCVTSLNSALRTAWPSVGCHCSFLPLCFPR